MKLLGIDFGLKRVGLAVTDTLQTMAFPLKTITRRTRQDLFDQLMEIITTEQIETVIIGLPLTVDGNQSLSTRQAQNFANSLKRRIDLPIIFVDERYSSQDADQDLYQANVKNKKKLKAVRDQQAAVNILNRWLAQKETL